MVEVKAIAALANRLGVKLEERVARAATPRSAFFATFAEAVGLDYGEVEEFIGGGRLDLAFLRWEFGADAVENGALLAAVHPSDRHSRPNVGWVAKMASALKMEVIVLCAEGTAERFQRGHAGFVLRPRGFRGRLVVATACLAEWQRVEQPGAEDEPFWQAYGRMPVYGCGDDGEALVGLPEGLLAERLRAESERLLGRWPGRQELEAMDMEVEAPRRQQPHYARPGQVVACPERTTVQELVAREEAELGRAAWEPQSRLDFARTSAQVLEEVETRGGRIAVRRTVDVDGYSFLLGVGQLCEFFGASELKVLFVAPSVREEERASKAMRALLEVAGRMGPGERVAAVRLGSAWAAPGRSETGLFLVAATGASEVERVEGEMRAAIGYALRLPCGGGEGHECTCPALIAHHRSNSTARRDLVVRGRGGREGGAMDVVGPGVMGCFEHHLVRKLGGRDDEDEGEGRGRQGRRRWRVELVGRNYDVKKSVVAEAEELPRLVGEIWGKLKASATRATILVDVAVQAIPEAVFEEGRRMEPLFAFWSSETISRMLFAARRLDCYGHYFTVDLAGYKGPSGLARLGEAKVYSTLFRLLTVGEEKMPVSYQGMAGRLLRAIAEGGKAVRAVAGEMEGRLAEEVGKLTQRLGDLEGSAALRLELTVQLKDLASQASLVLSQFDRLGLEEATEVGVMIAVLDRELLGRFFEHQLGLVARPLGRKLASAATSLGQWGGPRVRVELCAIAALESLATRCFWSGQMVSLVGDILFKATSLVSLRLRQGFARYNRLDLGGGGGSWDVEGMRPRLEGGEEVVMQCIRRIAGEAGEERVDHWVECLEVVLFMREEEIDVSERCRRLLVSYCKTVGKRLRVGVMEDPVDILRVAGARARVGDGFRVYAQRVGLCEAMEALFDERRLVEHRSWRHAFLYGFQELKAQTRRLDLIAKLCRVAEEEGVELVHHFLPEDAERFWPIAGHFVRLMERSEEERGAAAGGVGEGRGWRERGMAQRARRVRYSELEVEHLVIGLNWYGEGRGTMAAIAQDARLVFRRTGVRTGAELRVKLWRLVRSGRVSQREGEWLLDGARVGEGRGVEGGRVGNGRSAPRRVPGPVPARAPVPALSATPVPALSATPVPALSATPVPALSATPVPALTPAPAPIPVPVLVPVPDPIPVPVLVPVPALTAVPVFARRNHFPTPVAIADRMPSPAPVPASARRISARRVAARAPTPISVPASASDLVPARRISIRCATAPVPASTRRVPAVPVAAPAPIPVAAAVLARVSAPLVPAASTRPPPPPIVLISASGATRGLAREVVVALRRLIETNAGRTMSQSALARQLNSRVRPTAGIWQRILQRLEENGAVELMARSKQQRVRVVGWERVREEELWIRLD